MTVKFLGLKQQTQKTGCSSCGSRRMSKVSFQRSKKMVLPSGRAVFFTAGETYEVSDSDGAFLAGQTYLVNGKAEKAFEVV